MNWRKVAFLTGLLILWTAVGLMLYVVDVRVMIMVTWLMIIILIVNHDDLLKEIRKLKGDEE